MKTQNYVRAGAFFAVGLLLLGGSIFVLGKEKQIFATQQEFVTDFKDVKGLAVGAPIRLGGITIGRVSRIGFSSDLSDVRVHVTLALNTDYLDRVREDASVTIETLGLLGDRFVSLQAGSQGNRIHPGARIRPEEPADLASVLQKAGIIVDQTTAAADQLNAILQDIKREAISPLKDSLKNVSDITQEIKTGKGFIHQLVYSAETGDEIISSMERASKALASITEEVKTGKGLANSLFFSPEGTLTIAKLNAALDSMNSAGQTLNTLFNDVRQSKGVIHDLIYLTSDKEKAQIGGGFQQVIGNLEKTSDNLRRASEALSQGTGTLGALLIDPTLYNDLIQITDNAKRSFLLREAIKAALKK